MVLNDETKRYFRSLLFKHQDGIVVTNIITVLAEKNVFPFLEKERSTTLENLLNEFPFFHKGYLNVAIRSLASQGLLSYKVTPDTIEVSVTEKFNEFKKYINVYQKFSVLFTKQLDLLKTPFENTLKINSEIVQLASDYKELSQNTSSNSYFNNEVLVHVEAILLLPILVYINFKADTLDLDVIDLLNEDITSIFNDLGLLENGALTQKGQFLMDKSYAYGVTTSYFPIMANIASYLYGDFTPFFEQDEQKKEQHVLRAINVWGSGGAHSTYFKKFDRIIIDIFNRPLEQQPKGIIDVGCGNGALLAHIFNLIWNHTSRKDDLKNNKLIVIGADYNKEALLSTQHNLEKEDVWADVVWGDIGNPSEINTKLQENYDVGLNDLLNVRSFLDHNRPFNTPQRIEDSYHFSTGAFAHRGEHIKNREVEQSLVEHLEKWKPFINQYGLLLIELHTVNPEKVKDNLGRTPCTAYDVTHGFSDQYIVGVNAFNRAIEKAGMTIDKTHNYVFPNVETPTISINLIQ